MLLDEDAVTACADLVGRTGARNFQIGYLNDDPPHQWYAHAQYRGIRISVEDQPGPSEAADALCRQLLGGAKCMHCGGLVVLGDGVPAAYGTRMVDGSTFDAASAGRCRWRRMGPRWVRGCEGGDRPGSERSEG